MSGRHAEITGRGVVSAAGLDIADFGRSVLSATTCIGPLGELAPEGLNFQIGAPVRGFDPLAHLDARTAGGLDRFSQFATVAARQAWSEAGLAGDDTPPERIGVIIGTANAGHDILEKGWARIGEGKKPQPLTIPMTMGNAPACRIALEIGARGPVFAVTSACASASHAIMLALMMLRSGQADVMVAGGADACFAAGYLRAWESLRVMSPVPCRPFSKDRRGMSLGEGAGVVVLERAGRARARGARVLGELLGAAMTSSATELIAPESGGMARAMAGAIADAGLAPAEIGYVNAQGTATVANDRMEAAAIRQLFGDRGETLPVSSSKSCLGHAMGASGALELLVTVEALQRQIAPPTLNFTEADPDCPLDVVPNAPRPHAMRAALSNAFAFGGLNVTLAVGRPGVAGEQA